MLVLVLMQQKKCRASLKTLFGLKTATVAAAAADAEAKTADTEAAPEAAGGVRRMI
jgi:hypothetical protein